MTACGVRVGAGAPEGSRGLARHGYGTMVVDPPRLAIQKTICGDAHSPSPTRNSKKNY